MNDTLGASILGCMSRYKTSVLELSDIMEVPVQDLIDLIVGIKPMTPELAQGLEKAFGLPEEVWLETARRSR